MPSMNKFSDYATMTTWQENTLNILYAIVSIGSCLVVGQLLSSLIGGLPRSLYGLILFTLFLHFKFIKAVRIQASISWGIRNMGVCFVPAGVGIIEHYELVKHHGLAIVGLTFVSTLLLLTFVALVYQKFELNSKRPKQTNDA